MNLTCFRVHAFTQVPFGGNPACVIPLTTWPEDRWMLQMAKEMAVAETAYIGPSDDPENEVDFHLRQSSQAAHTATGTRICSQCTRARPAIPRCGLVRLGHKEPTVKRSTPRAISAPWPAGRSLVAVVAADAPLLCAPPLAKASG